MRVLPPRLRVFEKARSWWNVFPKRLGVVSDTKQAFPNNKCLELSVDFQRAPDTQTHTSWARGCAGVRVVGRGGPSNVAPVNSFSLHGESTGRDGNVEFSTSERVNHPRRERNGKRADHTDGELRHIVCW